MNVYQQEIYEKYKEDQRLTERERAANASAANTESWKHLDNIKSNIDSIAANPVAGAIGTAVKKVDPTGFVKAGETVVEKVNENEKNFADAGTDPVAFDAAMKKTGKSMAAIGADGGEAGLKTTIFVFGKNGELPGKFVEGIEKGEKLFNNGNKAADVANKVFGGQCKPAAKLLGDDDGCKLDQAEVPPSDSSNNTPPEP